MLKVGDILKNLREYSDLDMLNCVEFAKLIGVKVETIYKWRSLKKGPVITEFHNKRLYKVKDIKTFLGV